MLIQNKKTITIDQYADHMLEGYLYVVDPSQDEILKINQLLGLEENVIPEGLSLIESRRIFETDQGYLVTYMNIPEKTEEYSYHLLPVVFISRGDQNVVVAKKQLPMVESLLSHAIGKHMSSYSIQFVTDTYLDVLGLIANDIQEVIDRIKKNPVEKDMISVFSLQVSISIIDSSIDSLMLILEQGTEKKIFLSKKGVAEAKLQLTHAGRTIDTYISILQSAIDLVEGIMNNRLNDIMKFLTAMTVILSIPMIIAGFWGMDVPMPLGNYPYGFHILIIFSVVASGLTTWYLLRRKFF